MEGILTKQARHLRYIWAFPKIYGEPTKWSEEEAKRVKQALSIQEDEYTIVDPMCIYNSASIQSKEDLL